MKKLLSLMAAFGLTGTAGLNLLAVNNQSESFNINTEINKNNKRESKASLYTVLENWVISDTHSSISLDVETPTHGTHKRTDNESVSTVMNNSWDVVKSISNINIYGKFSYGTHKEPVEHNNETLRKDAANSTSTKLKFNFKYSHDKWKGWGHQTSEIAMTITITMAANRYANVQIDNYALARTAGSTHKCKTISDIKRIEFII